MTDRSFVLIPPVVLSLALAMSACSAAPDEPEQAAPATESAERADTVLASAERAQEQVQASLSDDALANSARDFLELWLARGAVQEAVESYVSTEIDDGRFLPGFSPGDAAALEATQVEPAVFEGRMAAYLQEMTGASPEGLQVEVSELLQPLTLEDIAVQAEVQEADRELLRFLEPHPVRSLPGLPGIAYPVQRWEDISWIAPPTVAYQVAMEERLETLGLAGQAVLCRFGSATPEGPGQLLFMLWVDEARTGAGWKLWGVEAEAIF